jgi:hypothetical protein
MKRWAEWAIAAALALAVVLLYRKVLRLWWTWDDAYLLHIAIVRAAREHFFAPSLWRSMPQRLFTPLLTASYDSELSLFGFRARPFYAIHLGELALLAVALYAMLRQWLAREAAAAGALLALLGAPVCVIATELMLMHYVEALILCCLAVILYRRGFTVASALLYFAAMLAKEIAVPLIVVLWLIRRRGVLAHAVALVAWIAWRTVMLGTLLGGYGYAVTPRDIPRLIALTPWRVAAAWAGAKPWVGAALVVLLLACVARKWRWVLLALVLTIAPILPVAKAFDARLAFVPWIAISVVFAFTFPVGGQAPSPVREAREDRRGRLSPHWTTAVVLLLALIINRQTWTLDYAKAKRQSDEARVFFDLGNNDLLAHPLIPPAAIGELRWLKEEWLHKNVGSGWYYDDLFVCDGKAAGKRVFAWQGRSVVETKPQCTPSRAAPLSAEFHHRGDSLFWRFGPYRDGTWSVVIADGIQAFDVPPEDGFQLPGVTALPLRVKYTSPQGWSTYSPELPLDFTRQPDFAFRR